MSFPCIPADLRSASAAAVSPLSSARSRLTARSAAACGGSKQKSGNFGLQAAGAATTQLHRKSFEVLSQQKTRARQLDTPSRGLTNQRARRLPPARGGRGPRAPHPAAPLRLHGQHSSTAAAPGKTGQQKRVTSHQGRAVAVAFKDRGSHDNSEHLQSQPHST